MNSFRTRDACLAALNRYSEIKGRPCVIFLQHRVPRVDVETNYPVEWTAPPDLEWCPPGHGDLYSSLQSRGLLSQLSAAGIRYAVVSNEDNLGGTLDLSILGWFASRTIPFAMEVADRTSADKKSGHLTRRERRLILRESAQCAPADLADFRNIRRHHYLNTNNLWLDLDALAAKLKESPACCCR
jgi:UTP--glucose-1-phosphate uridylyltransferase